MKVYQRQNARDAIFVHPGATKRQAPFALHANAQFVLIAQGNYALTAMGNEL